MVTPVTHGDPDTTFGGFRMSGGRYDQPGLPLQSLSELEHHERLIASVAQALYKARHPLRKRLPTGFRDAFKLRLAAIETGSVVPVPVR
jgi:hypothetical protein